MGGLIKALMCRCIVCKATALPLSISGVYLTGNNVILHECPNCHTVRKHGSRGPAKPTFRKSVIVGRLTMLLLAHARRETHFTEGLDYLDD
jgi:hypothetical protein